MLILSRRIGERIFIIGPDMQKVEVCITLLEIKGCAARIGIDADSSYTIHREEIFFRIAQEKMEDEGQG